jgi:hypothetical protein
MKAFIQGLLGGILCLLSGLMLYSLFVSTTFSNIVQNIRPLGIALFQICLFFLGLLAIGKQRTISLLTTLLLLVIELLFIGYVAKSIIDSINVLVK